VAGLLAYFLDNQGAGDATFLPENVIFQYPHTIQPFIVVVIDNSCCSSHPKLEDSN
jgi:hypothetical protein